MKKFSKIISLTLVVLLLATTLCGCAFWDITNQQGSGNGGSGNGGQSTLTDKFSVPTSAQTSYDTVTNVNVAEVVANVALQYTYEVYCEIDFTYVQSSYWGSGQIRSATQTGEGTAFCINKDGYLITNAHVVNVEDSAYYNQFAITSRNIYVNLYNQDKQLPCSIVAYDEQLDLALLKIDQSGKYLDGTSYQLEGDLPYATFFAHQDPTDAKSTVFLNYGEYSVVVGNANGYGIAVTTGVVSAPFRYFVDSNNVYTKAIQTDAAINPGNSGGPLLNAYAAVIGVNSFKIVQDATEAMGYAIPSYEVLRFVDSLNTGNYDKTTTKGGGSNTNTGAFTGIENPVIYYTTTQRQYVKAN